MQVSKVVVQFDRSDIRHDRENCIRIVLVINWSGHVRTQYITWPICVRLKEPNNDENRAWHVGTVKHYLVLGAYCMQSFEYLVLGGLVYESVMFTLLRTSASNTY